MMSSGACFRFNNAACPDDSKLDEARQAVPAQRSAPRAPELESCAPAQTIAFGGGLLSGIFAPGPVIDSFPKLGRSSHLVSSRRASLGIALVWWDEVFTAGTHFYVGRCGGELPPANPFLVWTSWGSSVHRLYPRSDSPARTVAN